MDTRSISHIAFRKETLARGRHRMTIRHTENVVTFYQEDGDRRTVWQLTFWNQFPNLRDDAEGESHHLMLTHYWGREHEDSGLSGFKHVGKPCVYELDFKGAYTMFTGLAYLADTQFTRKTKDGMFWRGGKPATPYNLILPKKLEAA